MFVIKKGCLSMDNYDLDHLSDEIEDGYSPKGILESELSMVGLDISKVYSIQLNGEQLRNKRYLETYSKIVCDF